MNGINRQPLYIKGEYALIARHNKSDGSVEIADIHTPDMGWTTYDPTQGASSDELTKICNSLYDRCLLAELGVDGFRPADQQQLVKIVS
tara:strand:+ start:318 stop:584 length:267 start_codon:yes stop_codon:yes gene_type:complete